IVEPDIVEEAEALVDLLEDRLGYLVLGRSEVLVEAREPGGRIGDRAGRGERNVLAGDLDRQRLGAEAGAAAGLARVGSLVVRKLLAHPGALGRKHAALEVADHAL